MSSEAARAQRKNALERADRVRKNRAQLKASVKDGRQSVADVLDDIQDWSAGMRVLDLLKAQHRWGRTRSMNLLLRVNVRDTATLGEITPTQRRRLANAIQAMQ